jgi:hypothetical protein
MEAPRVSTAALVVSDVLLIAAFMCTRRLWFPWGIHWGWNFLQDGVFGMPNSGITSLPSWIRPIIRGPEWLTGGAFGIEASAVSVLLSVAVGIYLLKRARGASQILTPSWKRKRTLFANPVVKQPQ